MRTATGPDIVDGRRVRRDRNRDAVVDALLTLYGEGNLEPGSAEIAERAGLSPRSLFRYFDDVDDLCEAAIARQAERILPLTDIAAGPTDPLDSRIGAFVNQRITMFDAMGHVGAVARLRAPFLPLVAAELSRMRGFLRDQLRQLFAGELAALPAGACQSGPRRHRCPHVVRVVPVAPPRSGAESHRCFDDPRRQLDDAARRSVPDRPGGRPMKVLRTPDERFADLPDFPFAPHYVEIDDGDGGRLRIHYLDEGPADAPPVLLMHGEPSWSYLYRHMIPVLVSAGHRCVAPDLVGFGRSDKPADRSDYTYARHVEWMRRALFDELDLRGITFFGQDWGGLVGLRLVAEQPDRFSRVVIGNTGLPTGDGCATDAFLAWQKFSQEVPVVPGRSHRRRGLVVHAPARSRGGLRRAVPR